MPPSARAPWLGWLLLPLVVAGFAALWTLIALMTGRQASWMAVAAAVDALWVTSLGKGMPPGRRAAVSVVATLAITLLAQWSIIAAYMGVQMGFGPWDSIWKLGMNHAITLAQLANGWGDLAWLGAALVLAAGWPFFSGPRPPPSTH